MYFGKIWRKSQVIIQSQVEGKMIHFNLYKEVLDMLKKLVSYFKECLYLYGEITTPRM